MGAVYLGEDQEDKEDFLDPGHPVHPGEGDEEEETEDGGTDHTNVVGPVKYLGFFRLNKSC